MQYWNWVEINPKYFHCSVNQNISSCCQRFLYKLRNENSFYKAFSEIDLSMINFKWERLQNTNIILQKKMRVHFSVIAISANIAGPNKNQEGNKSFLEYFSIRYNKFFEEWFIYLRLEQSPAVAKYKISYFYFSCLAIGPQLIIVFAIHRHHLIIALCFSPFHLSNWEYLDLFPSVTEGRLMREVSNYKPNMNIFGRGLARYQASLSYLPVLCSVTYQLPIRKLLTLRYYRHKRN